MIRIFDISFSIIFLIILFPLFLLIFLIAWIDTGSPLFFQKRVGFKLKTFTLVKFRTMNIDTASKATHLVDSSCTTTLGKLLRSSKIDELPQLWNILKGDMSFVGPRPCLLNQKKLIIERKKKNIFNVRPGLTGLSQINRVTMETPKTLTKLDLKMIKDTSINSYFYYILLTMKLIIQELI